MNIINTHDDIFYYILCSTIKLILALLIEEITFISMHK